MKNVIDHVAIGAANLEQGIAALQKQFGVEVPKGGKHEAMSTHNCVTKVGDGHFLEIIAIDPDAPDPGRTRWFTLDDPGTQARVSERPCPLCWVVGTDDLDAVVANSPVDLGEVVNLSRGDLSWRLTVPADGSLPEGGLLPAFIEWSPGLHPSEGMQDLGLRLEAINLRHPDPAALSRKLEALGVDHLATVMQGAEPAISFVIRSADGKTSELV